MLLKAAEIKDLNWNSASEETLGEHPACHLRLLRQWQAFPALLGLLCVMSPCQSPVPDPQDCQVPSLWDTPGVWCHHQGSQIPVSRDHFVMPVEMIHRFSTEMFFQHKQHYCKSNRWNLETKDPILGSKRSKALGRWACNKNLSITNSPDCQWPFRFLSILHSFLPKVAAFLSSTRCIPFCSECSDFALFCSPAFLTVQTWHTLVQ